MHRLVPLCSFALLSVTAACDDLVDGSHQGEVLVTVEGSLRTTRVEPLAKPEVSVVYTRRSAMGGLVGAESVSAEGLFPQFQLSIYNPPPASILEELDGDLFAAAYVVVGTPETDYTSYTGWYGVDLDRMLIYLPEATKADSTLEYFLHGPQTAGFHIYSVYRLDEVEYKQRLDCVNAIPQNGGMITQHDMYKFCGGAGRDELMPTEADLETLLDIEIVEDAGIVELINSLPWW